MVLVGPSGCGKSSILRMIAGLEEISEGSLYIGGERVNDVSPDKRNIAMVFQNYALYPHMTVAKNMGFSLRLQHVARAIRDRVVGETANVLGLSDLLERQPAPTEWWTATTGGHGTRHGARPPGFSARRTSFESGRQVANADAFGGAGTSAPSRFDDDLCHPRPNRSHDHGPTGSRC